MNKTTLAFLFALFCGLTAHAQTAAQTMACPAGTEDMMNYFVMGYPQRLGNYMGPGNANPIYTTIHPELGASFAMSGYFVWDKGSAGYPWDVKTFDNKYVYDRTTELTWNDPTSFKRFTTDLPMSARCVPVNAAPPPINLNPAATSYSFYESCSAYQTANLNYAVNTITAPEMVDSEGNLGTVKTRYFNYQYGCDSTYDTCTDREVFSLGYQVGLYEWQHYQFDNGNWTLVQQSNINEFDSGSATPYFPCSNSY